MRKLFAAIIALLALSIAPAEAASSYTSCLLAELPVPGDPAVRNTWGTIENTGRSLMDTAIAGGLSLSVAGAANVILTSTAGAADQSRAAHYTFTGVLTGNITVFWPAYCRTFSVRNNTTGNFTLTLAVNNGSGAAAGATAAVAQGNTVALWSDATNINKMIVGLDTTARIVVGTTGTSGEIRFRRDSDGAEAGRVYEMAGGVGLGIEQGGGSTYMAFITGSSALGSNTERMRIEGGGNGAVFIGQTAQTGSTSRLYVKANGGIGEYGVAINMASVASNPSLIEFQNNGTIIGQVQSAASSVAYQTTSDERLKDFSVPQKDWRREILAIKVREFKWRKDGEAGFGISAQQTYEHFPFAISKPDDPEKTWSADYGKLAPLALWGVQDLYRENLALQGQVRFLASRIDAMESRLLDQAAAGRR